MSGHAKAERLSLYLDAALSSAERRRVEDHLEACPACRQRLDGLRRVVDGLGRLPTAAPPEDLAARVGRAIELRGRPSRWHRLLDGAAPGPLLGAPPMHLLALVLALGAIVYLFAHGLDKYAARPTRIVLPDAAASLRHVPPPEAPARLGPAADGDSLHLLGGRFRRRQGVWVEDGLGGRPPDSRLELGLAGVEALPEAAELAALGAPLRLRVGREVVEIAFRPASPEHPPGR